MIPANARYNYCVKKSIEFLLREEITMFPFCLEKTIQRNKWGLTKYTELAEKLNVDVDSICRACMSLDGYSILTDNYVVAYNNTLPYRRVRFTLAHELGHIYLHHFKYESTKLGRLAGDNYKVLEKEANCFARNILAPAPIIDYLGLNTPREISQAFGISIPAAQVRLEFLRNDLNRINKNVYDIIIYSCKDFIKLHENKKVLV